MPAEHRGNEYRPPYADQPLITQHPPEEGAYVQAYQRVGRPRITVWVNRTLEGQLVSATPAPAEIHEEKFDSLAASAIDYDAVEAILTDWLAANGQVTIISPLMARQRLTDEQVKDLQKGQQRVLGEMASQLNADVLVQVQMRPTKQTPAGLEGRLVAEAINTRGGQSIGRAVVDVPPPLEKAKINEYTRFVARKLMDDMTGAWMGMPIAPSGGSGSTPTSVRQEPNPPIPGTSPALIAPPPVFPATRP
jgi:hypothetical protein